MAIRYSYLVDLRKSREGGYSVTFPDFDEAFADGDTCSEPKEEAADRLEEALADRIARRQAIPAPSRVEGRPAVVPGAILSAKAELCEIPREQRLSYSAFAVP